MGKIGAVLISHGSLANELLEAARTVYGDVEHIAAVSIGWHDDVSDAETRIERAIKEVSDGAGVLLLTDMFGGTPTNIAAMFIREGETEVLTGMNLPMVIKIASQNRAADLAAFAEEVEMQGKKSIYRAGELLVPKMVK
jgi:PTS system mannose-specific IIA component